MDSLVTISKGDRSHTIPLNKLSKIALCRGGLFSYEDQPVEIISDTELEIDGARLVGSSEAIQGLIYLFGMDIEPYEKFRAIANAKECNFILIDTYLFADKPERTRVNMGIHNSIFFSLFDEPSYCQGMVVKTIKEGVRITFYNRPRRGGRGEGYKIISGDALDRDIFLEMLGEVGITLGCIEGDNTRIFYDGVLVPEIEVDFIFRAFEEIAIEWEKRRQRCKSAKK